jgi:hypothetical protein
MVDNNETTDETNNENSDCDNSSEDHSSHRKSSAAELAELKLEQDQQTFNQNIQQEKWFKDFWRPAMAYCYILICLFDFVIAPMLVMFLFRADFHQWTSLTLQNGGLIHVAFGAILGITSWTRSAGKR